MMLGVMSLLSIVIEATDQYNLLSPLDNGSDTAMFS